MDPLTSRERDVVLTLHTLKCIEGVPPTLKEAAEVLGISRPTLHESLGNLVAKGWLKHRPFAERGYTLTRGALRKLPQRSALRALRLAWKLADEDERQAFLRETGRAG